MIPAIAPQVAEAPNQAAIQTAAKEFEAILIAAMLKSARAADQTGDANATQELAEQQLAVALAGGGGLGLGTLVAQQMTVKTVGRPVTKF